MKRSVLTRLFGPKQVAVEHSLRGPTLRQDNHHVLFLGAGATAACGGPLTNEILPQDFELLHSDPRLNREDLSIAVRRFLIDNFHLPINRVPAPTDYPPLPLLLSLIDKALERGEGFRSPWSGDQLKTVRYGIEYLIFVVIDHALHRLPQNPHIDILRWLSENDRRVTVISLNYDIIADNTLARLYDALPDYNCEIATPLYRESRERCGQRCSNQLLKLHGSLNWIYCPNLKCQRLDVGLSESGRQFVKARADLYAETELAGRYSCQGTPCSDCKTTVRPVMITPTSLKDYANPHIAQVWRRAAEVLQEAGHVHIVGYSLPPEDVDVIYLLKSNLGDLRSNRIHLVDLGLEGQKLAEHATGRNYRSLFGDDVDWHPEGFVRYVETLTGGTVETRTASPGIFRA